MVGLVDRADTEAGPNGVGAAPSAYAVGADVSLAYRPGQAVRPASGSRRA